MNKEYNQIKQINELLIDDVIFVSSSGYEKNEYNCIDISDIYSV